MKIVSLSGRMGRQWPVMELKVLVLCLSIQGNFNHLIANLMSKAKLTNGLTLHCQVKQGILMLFQKL